MTLRAFTVITIFSAGSALGQINTVSIPRQNTNITKAARTKANELTLPFWDDFSFTKSDFPADSLWADGNSVWVNDGLGINPPSIRVATFDGTDATGAPYNVNDVLAKGYADKLESQVIRIDQVDASLRPFVYISFFYQMKGRGEVPDQGDLLILQFRNSDDKWETVWSAENDGSLDPTTFYQVVLPITGENFYHDAFQFRFQNFARLSGPYDTWHVDYVFISNGINSNDPPAFPDRTIVTPMTSLFGDFFSVPYKHFIASNGSILRQPKLLLTNQRGDQIIRPNEPAGQPVSFNSSVSMETFKQASSTASFIKLDSARSAGDALVYKTFHEVSLNKIPGFSQFDQEADSIQMNLFLKFNTADNEVKTDSTGDYRPEVYAPVDFRSNDTLSTSYSLSSFYAYDDGSAEYGAALNQPGAMIAYEYNLVGVPFDSVAALDLYFPRFGDESSHVIELRIWSALTDNPEDLIYREVVTLQRSTQNLFWRKKLTESKRVPSRFYIGWKQSTASVIAVGLDKNTNSGGRMFYNTIGTWVQNQQVSGSLMLRPVFGKGRKGVETGSEREIQFATFPNPTNGTFSFTGHASQINIYDVTGRPVGFEELKLADQTQVTLQGAKSGLYILRVEQNGATKTSKLLVHH
jgi:Secretion system C-terminal sorting domain